ncbi:alpha-L-Rha alpha-1,3-L-rhamnosyltransferase [Carnobacterium maltaromaticum]|uniref:glycosyltransferase family 2 protein n=1 Tax=Carnobacterium maltaromaticum TaxID=2751 RepID=UPI000C786C87|nr:glycosyltransferase family 2 protein [Carnobacterium maltaromaticum]PLS36909.1 alpha-L-Rha alpha-1,3-L-rhamnosyltransferase [Carnobacterium maltaromaticum]PLS37724.1 alpha-L-Rha alpha-1,3-L-rhamnosyltransferase [Carnobacterium maltaromaticum]PLS39665.1 alpha-L-Rha alpha-1,3-L-rhamnosyltransferase [Carnobacterium maltaromaticum]PLS44421.1 alpha-L-Rha alpha-1,3-L-rhamnosyltransferase [Carnobacterium maltaromaticum]PLS46455.1 alpha-L-Rha alpha-1,3-L-rhamnosyltransferase [Carnobacterium maltaro
MNVSVAMATYNGENFLKQQIDSILIQLGEEDELIISDDHSSDQTIAIVENYSNSDPRVKLFFNSGKGVTSNFDNAIKKTSKDIIFLCDQDDIWKSNKVAVIKEYYQNNPEILMIMSDITVVDNDLNPTIDSFYEFRGSRTGVLKNIIKNSYIGCAMSFRKELKKQILPIPKKVPMHDMWIGLVADSSKSALLIPEKLIYYRRHENTVTTVENKSSLKDKVMWRFQIISLLLSKKIKK